MKKFRDVFYVISGGESEITYYGMDFKEFIEIVPEKIQNILMLKGDANIGNYSNKCNFEIIEGEAETKNLAAQDTYGYGDFCFVDYEKAGMAETLTPTEVSELLYLSHIYKPLKSPFFNHINNKYAYLAHDDGWFCRLFCRNRSDTAEIISNKILNTASVVSGKHQFSINNNLKIRLLEIAKKGLLVDFSDAKKDKTTLELSLYAIGNFLDMDEMYNNLDEHKKKAEFKGKLIMGDEGTVLLS